MTLWSKGRLWWIAGAIIMLGGPIIGVVAGRLASRAEHERIYKLCDEYFSQRAMSLREEIHSISETLYALKSFFDASVSVTREEFRTFTREVPERHPSIQALEWIPRISANQRHLHEQQARAEGLQGYRIMAWAAGENMTVAPLREEHYPVFFVEPFAANRPALGFDLSSERVRNAALIRAVRTKAISLSDPVDVVQSTGTTRGILAFLPVYRSPEVTAGTSQNEPAGLVLVVINAREMLKSALLPCRKLGAPPMSFELIDEDVDGKPLRLESSSSWQGYFQLESWTLPESIDLGGQRWQLIGRPTQAYVAENLTNGPLVLGMGLFLLWEAVGAALLFTLKWHENSVIREQGRVFEATIRSLTEGVVAADRNGKFLLFNPAAEKIVGIGLKDLDMTAWSETYGCFYPDARTPFPSERLPLARALTGEEALEEVFIRNPSVPEGVWIIVSGAPLRDAKGVLQGGVVVFRDITESKRASEELRSSLRQLEELKYAVDQATIVSITDHQGKITYVNDKFCEISGYSRQELLGQNHRMMNSGYHPQKFFSDLWETISAGRVWRGTVCDRARDGERFWTDMTVVRLLNEDGGGSRFMALRSDITDRMRQQDELLRLSNAVEQTADTVFITNRHGVIEYVNPAFESTTGYSREEALGQTPRILKSGRQDPKYYEELWKTILAGTAFRSRVVNRKKQGEIYHAEQTITPIRDSEGQVTHFVSVVKDMTDRIRRQQQELEMQYASAVQQKLFPLRAPGIEGYDIAGAAFPALETSGDYFDYVPLLNNALGLVVADISGHGLGPALVMMETRACLRLLAKSCSDPHEILDALNEVLYPDLEPSCFVALVLARIDVSSRSLSYVNAGHTSGYHLDQTGGVKAVLASKGPPLGLSPDERYESSESLALEAGDIVVLLTDGVTEAQDSSGDLFGTERTLDVIRAHSRESAHEIVQHLHRAARNFAQEAPQEDDITIVVCKVARAPIEAGS